MVAIRGLLADVARLNIGRYTLWEGMVLTGLLIWGVVVALALVLCRGAKRGDEQLGAEGRVLLEEPGLAVNQPVDRLRAANGSSGEPALVVVRPGSVLAVRGVAGGGAVPP